MFCDLEKVLFRRRGEGCGDFEILNVTPFFHLKSGFCLLSLRRNGRRSLPRFSALCTIIPIFFQSIKVSFNLMYISFVAQYSEGYEQRNSENSSFKSGLSSIGYESPFICSRSYPLSSQGICQILEVDQYDIE
mmetsp:Transcript_15145/g.26831  ORF Transcript_15145/g.26831 Transcript_15145/m.26831 type:complete len:133 (+) Transcript_15145:86-484(+)